MNIVNAARRCFAERGIAVSVEEICIEAGISKGAFYGYFASKDAAIEAIAGDHRGAFDGLAEIRQVDALADRLYAYAHDGDSRSTRLELEAWAYSLQQPALRAILQENIQHMRAALSRNSAVLSKVSKHSGKSLPPIALVIQIFATGLVASMALGVDKQGADQEDSMREALNYMLDALLKDHFDDA